MVKSVTFAGEYCHFVEHQYFDLKESDAGYGLYILVIFLSILPADNSVASKPPACCSLE